MTIERPHLLYTAWSFPPSRAGGVYRAAATANAFAENGWDVTVLTVPRELFISSTGVDLGLEERLNARINIVRIDPHVPAYIHDLAQWPRSRARWPKLWRIADFRHDMVRFPEPNYGRWRPAIEQAAERVHAIAPVDVAIGTGNPHVDFVPGWHLRRRFGVPFVIDYRDAWQLNVFTGKKQVSAVPPVAWWERRFISSASEVWFVNEPIRRWHADRYPGASAKMHVVANGFDRYDSALEVPVRDRDGEADSLVFGYIGTITPHVPLGQLLAGWRMARSSGGAMAHAQLVLRGYLGHFGEADVTAERMIGSALADGVSYDGPVAKTEIGATYQGFDALVLALGTGRFVTSGKVYEYAATGLPIVSVHDLGNAASDVLRESPVWVPTASLEPGDIADALCRAAEIAVSQSAEQRRAAQKWGAQYERSRQLAPRIEALRAGIRC